VRWHQYFSEPEMADDIVKNVLVIGAGVSGLTTALALVRRVRYHGIRFNVKLFAEHYHNDYKSDPSAPQLVSTIAGALWEFPPAVCGMHGNQLLLQRDHRQ
jgi:D-amino-acid oxidase